MISYERVRHSVSMDGQMEGIEWGDVAQYWRSCLRCPWRSATFDTPNKAAAAFHDHQRLGCPGA